MGAIARNAANLITTSGVVLKGAVNNDSFDNVTALPSSLGDGITLISSQTASASASISFTSGIDSTYKVYKFVFINCHPSSASTISFLGSTNGGSSYGITKTSASFYAIHTENDATTSLSYNIYQDLAQSTSRQGLVGTLSTDSDSSGSGDLYIFNPSSTTFVKHYIANANGSNAQSTNSYTAGYFNTTSAINAIKFEMSVGNIDSGTIYMYGIK